MKSSSKTTLKLPKEEMQAEKLDLNSTPFNNARAKNICNSMTKSS